MCERVQNIYNKQFTFYIPSVWEETIVVISILFQVIKYSVTLCKINYKTMFDVRPSLIIVTRYKIALNYLSIITSWYSSIFLVFRCLTTKSIILLPILPWFPLIRDLGNRNSE